MKKTIFNIFILIFIFMIFVSNKSFAVSLNSLDVQINKTLARPGEQVQININFSESLVNYTLDVAYDNSIFDFISAEGGVAQNLGDKIRISFSNDKRSNQERTNETIIFKAKEELTTSNPTNFAITATDLKNHNWKTEYDSILIPISKEIVVEPEYKDYTLNLEYEAEEIISKKDIQMELSLNSDMGRYYDKIKLLAEVLIGNKSDIKLFAIDSDNIEHDIIQEGWGNPENYKIGGKDVNQVLKVRGVFEKPGEYEILLKLIDTENGNKVITSKTLNINVNENLQDNSNDNDIYSNNDENNNDNISIEKNKIKENIGGISEKSKEDNINLKNLKTKNITNNTIENLPAELPKTGENTYVPATILVVLLSSILVYLYNRNKE